MSALLNRVREFLHCDEGPTATEYAVMLGLIIVVCIASIGSIGNTISGTFSNLDGKLAAGMGS